MTKAKSVLVVTTNSIEDVSVKKYIKPISAHVVSGVNIFNDFLGGITDVFGGRSNTYQKQLSSLYDEVVFKIKKQANELGANCVLGLKVDIDEISGKGKSMLMITAIGTAVILEEGENVVKFDSESNVISAEYLKYLSKKNKLLNDLEKGNIAFNEEVWGFVIDNKIEEVLPFIIKEFEVMQKGGGQYTTDFITNFKNKLSTFVEFLPFDNKTKILYKEVKGASLEVSGFLINIIKTQHLFDYDEVVNMINSDDFETQKKGLFLSIVDKEFYTINDLEALQALKNLIEDTFKERGNRWTKKQLLSKEKEVWECECGKSKSNEIGETCNSCSKDIYGFNESDNNPDKCISILDEKIMLISKSLNN